MPCGSGDDVFAGVFLGVWDRDDLRRSGDDVTFDGVFLGDGFRSGDLAP